MWRGLGLILAVVGEVKELPVQFQGKSVPGRANDPVKVLRPKGA